MTGRVKMACTRCHRAPLDHVVFRATAAERDLVRQAVTNFAKAHASCANYVDLPERSKRHRCGDCGIELLFGAECPFHAASVRVRWTEELARAYVVAVDALAGGLTPPNRDVTEYQAIVLARKWGGMERQDVSREAQVSYRERVS